MPSTVLIAGGTGRMGQAIARDLLAHTLARLILASRNRARGETLAAALGARGDFRPIDLDHARPADLAALLEGVDLAILAAGPFHLRPPTLLEACIAAGVNYVDLCDDCAATQARLALDAAAQAAGITALIDTGTFPGIDSVIVAEALSRRPQADTVRLYFVCAGSGGGGFGVLQTTFLAVTRPYCQLRDGRRVETPSFRDRQVVNFGPPLGPRPVYNFEVPEVWSLAHAFPQLRTCTSKFGAIPELWNWATIGLARAPERFRGDHAFLDRSADFILPAVHWLDRWVGEALGIRVEVAGPDGPPEAWQYYAPSTVDAVGWASGLAAGMVLEGAIATPGVLLPETHIPPQAYLARLLARGGRLAQVKMRA